MKANCSLLFGLLILAFIFLQPAGCQVIKSQGCTVDLEIVALPSCAVAIKGDRLYVAKAFVGPLFSGSTSRLSSRVLPDVGWAYFDRTGLVRVKGVAPFDNGASYFHFGLVRVIANGKYGLANDQGAMVTSLYDGMEEFDKDHHGWRTCNSCHVVKHGEYSFFEGGAWVWLDRKGRVVGGTKQSD